MTMVVMAHDARLFLIAWEIMALAAFFAATVEHHNPDVREAGWIYLIATHCGTLAITALFALWYAVTGSFTLSLTHTLPAAVSGVLFILAFVGFGLKAGIMPLHVWLPGAHANAPSHVSALMSGVMLKMGIYGILRITMLVPTAELWWGYLLIITGAVTSVAGILFAVSQRDIKRLLAYSSIENIGIITMGIGLALLGRHAGNGTWIALGLGGALLHTWNHGIFKSLLFFNAGAVIHAVHTREIDQLGGLGKKMPKTALLFVVGAIAITALPPLNGFVSEWITYLGLFGTLFSPDNNISAIAGLGAVALATTGAIAIACFVKLLGTVFLGNRRSCAVDHAADPPLSMYVPMLLLALGSLAIGLFPSAVLPHLDGALRLWAGSAVTVPPVATLLPLHTITTLGCALLLGIILLALVTGVIRHPHKTRSSGTWDCGYAAPTPHMQYTGSSFGNFLVKTFGFMLRPQTAKPVIRELYPPPATFTETAQDTVLDGFLRPLFRIAGTYLPMARFLQRGRMHSYVLYILVIVIVLILLGRSS